MKSEIQIDNNAGVCQIDIEGTIGVPDAYRGENVKTYVVVKPGQTLTEEEVKAFCRDSLAAYKVPKLVAFIDALPKSAVGKILRRELRDLDAKMQAGKS